MTWFEDAACRDADLKLFFPDSYSDGREAKAICHRCPVQQQCLEYALANGEHYGIWGKTGLHQREAIIRRRRRTAGTYQPQTIRHGTQGGYRAHLRRDEEPCLECRRANADTIIRSRREQLA